MLLLVDVDIYSSDAGDAEMGKYPTCTPREVGRTSMGSWEVGPAVSSFLLSAIK